MILSILTPAVPARLDAVRTLSDELSRQIGDRQVEHLILLDNRKRTIGEKRDALLRIAQGQYVAFCDDDDWISSDYVSQILSATNDNPDVITFRQHCTVNGCEGEILFRLGNENEDFKPGGVAKRNAWHLCAWRRTLAILSHFPPCNYGEDWAYASKLCSLKGLVEAHIPRVLHYYRHDKDTSLAPAPLTGSA